MADQLPAQAAEVTPELDRLGSLAELPGGISGALEAILMVVDEPISESDLATVLQLETNDVREHLMELASRYAAGQHGFIVRQVGDGWRFYSHPAYACVIERLVVGTSTARLSQAALETLAVIAYRQPISRGRISAVRGVNVDAVVRTLLLRGLIREADTAEAGRDADVQSHSPATRFVTTDYFLDRMGMSSLQELPPIAPYLPDVDALDELAEGNL